jgi:hypothetical protein
MKLSLLLVLTLILGYGCAAKKLAIENADRLISYQMTKRLSLYSSQKAQLAKDIDQFLNKTKPDAQELLPIIDEIHLEEPAKAEAQYLKLEKYFNKVSQDFSAIMAKYLAVLDQKQQKELFKTLEDENREIFKQEKEKRIDVVEDRLKMFIGKLNGEQKELIREYSDYFHSRAIERLDRRIKLHHKFKEIYNQDISASSREKLFLDSFIKYQEDSLINDKNVELLKKFVPTVTKDQREYFRKIVQEVKGLIKYFISIEY